MKLAWQTHIAGPIDMRPLGLDYSDRAIKIASALCPAPLRSRGIFNVNAVDPAIDIWLIHKPGLAWPGNEVDNDDSHGLGSANHYMV